MSLTICLSSEAWHKKLFSADLADWLVSSSGGPSGRGQQRRPVFGRLRARHDLDEVLMPIASRRYAGGRGLLVTPLLNGGIQVASRGLDLREAVVLVLTGFRVEQTVMGQAHPCQVVFCPVGSIPRSRERRRLKRSQAPLPIGSSCVDWFSSRTNCDGAGTSMPGCLLPCWFDPKISGTETAQEEPSASSTAWGFLAMTASRILAGPSGRR